ncbi:hypothetical protein Tco_0549919, partial [Tanacetum coccineum]
GEAAAWPVEGTSLLVAPNAFSTIVANLFKVSVTLFNRLGRESKVLKPIEYSSVQQPGR